MPLERLTAALQDRYRVERQLGQGGMATVYLARDLRHERPVALKVLHPELGALLGSERFLAEIRTTANLQHPNILQLFDSGAADGLVYYTMPFVEGETLRARLEHERQLPVEDALRIAQGVAAALDYAHRHGVIHRDIKPENILLQDGQPLVADFGIALAVKAAGGARLTQTGLSLGTPQYMSPEQATAERELDARSDVYSLAAVVYEMLAGEPPFSGASTQAVIARLMTEEPRRLSGLRKAVPPHVEAAVHRALEKLPADRFATAAQFAEALAGRGDAVAPVPAGGVKAVRPDARRSSTRAIALSGGLAAVALAIGLGLGRWSAPEPEPRPSHLAIDAAGEGVGIAGQGRTVAISPDGEIVAYFSLEQSETGSQVKLRRLDRAASVPIPGAGGLIDLHFGRDGRFLYGTGLGSTMMRITLAGGSPTAMPAVPATPYAAWDSDGSIYVNNFLRGRSLQRIRPDGRAESITWADSVNTTPVIQQVLPGDRELLVVVYPRSGNAGTLQVLNLEGGQARSLLDFPVVEARYAAGLLIYVRPDGTMSTVQVDRRSLSPRGEAVLLAENISLSGAGVAQFAVSDNGTVAYVPAGTRELVLVDRTGTARPLLEAKATYHSPRFSPDGRRIALDFVAPDGRDVWVLDREQGTLSRVTFERDGHDPTWSTDGRWVWFLSGRSGTYGAWRVRPGTPAAESLLVVPTLTWNGVPFPDGRVLVVTTEGGSSGLDLMTFRPDRGAGLEPWLLTPFNEGWPALSPDGKWVAYAADQSGRFEVYVRAVSGASDVLQVSANGGSEPVWNPNGTELFFRDLATSAVDLAVARLTLNGEPRVVERKKLFGAADYDASQPHANYDIAPDGTHFVMVRRSPAGTIGVIQNLPELVDRLQRRGAAR